MRCEGYLSGLTTAASSSRSKELSIIAERISVLVCGYTQEDR
jgi:hypothetical protein